MSNPYPPEPDHGLYEDVYVSDKKRLLALLLALLFGVFGVHRFYVGKSETGAVMLLLDLTMVGFAITGVWSMIDALFIAFGEFTDADGYKLLEWT